MSPPRCATCQWFYPHEYADQCRRFPPLAAVADVVMRWPHVEPTDFCGEHTQAEETHVAPLACDQIRRTP